MPILYIYNSITLTHRFTLEFDRAIRHNPAYQPLLKNKSVRDHRNYSYSDLSRFIETTSVVIFVFFYSSL